MEYLRLDAALPFPLRDGNGKLLLAAEHKIGSPALLASLQQQALYTGEHEAVEWRRRMAEKVNGLLNAGATLNKIAAALPDKQPQGEREQAPLSFQVELDTLVLQLDALLRQVDPESGWLDRFLPLQQAAQALASRRFDSTVYLLVQAASGSTERYSAHHVLLTAAVAVEVASQRGWSAEECDRLFSACLTMNVAMTRQQDMLMEQTGALSEAQRTAVREHAVRGAMMLKAAGVADLCWLDAVARHHQPEPDRPWSERPPGQRLAALIRRVDIFGAKLSRRSARKPMSPIQAAREACLGPDGKPDELGGALLRAVGLYPPGSFVRLESGEVGVVVARGRRANLPLVVTLIGASGLPLHEPALRDTVERRHMVKEALAPAAVKVRPPHERLLEIIRLHEQRRSSDTARAA